MKLAAQLEQESEFRWRLKQDQRLGMRTDVVVFASRKLLNQIQEDQSLEQAVNVASLPGIAGPSLAMPDIHQGYGFPIGGVAATRMEDGVFPPAAWASISTAEYGC